MTRTGMVKTAFPKRKARCQPARLP